MIGLDHSLVFTLWVIVILSSSKLTSSVLGSIPANENTNGFIKPCPWTSDSVKIILNPIELGPILISDRDPAYVLLRKVSVHGFPSVTVISLSNSKDNVMLNLTFSDVQVSSAYRANASIGHLFHVQGKGSLHIKVDFVELLISVEKETSGQHQTDLMDLNFSVPKLLTDRPGPEPEQVLSFDPFFRESLGKAILWKVFFQLKDSPTVRQQIHCFINNAEAYTTQESQRLKKLIADRAQQKKSAVASEETRHKRAVDIENSEQTYKIPNDQDSEKYWFDLANQHIDKSRNSYQRLGVAKNVILFIGDGMGVSTLTAARILKGQKDGLSDAPNLQFEKFPNSALIKTFNLDKHVPDSAGTATAFLSGVKANFHTVGVNGKVNEREHDCDMIKKNSVQTIMNWAQDAEKATGVVTTTRITHATPAASYSHAAHRQWESDVGVKNFKTLGQCKDIALQLVEDEPGSKLNVILGGGRKNMLPKEAPDLKWLEKRGVREDGMDLIEEWKKSKKTMNQAHAFVNSTKGLKEVPYDDVDYLMGLFSHDHFPFDSLRDKSDEGEPSLSEMTEAAINVVKKNPNGFVLLIEGGLIDWAHHANKAWFSLHEVLELEKAVNKALQMVSLDETLIVVTADHSHGFTINGYGDRNQSIFGFSDYKEIVGNKKVPFTTLLYATGPGNNKPRKDPRDELTHEKHYTQHSAINLTDSTHGGEDVALYSDGPNSHLFNGLMDQTSIPHMIAYAACIGRFVESERCSMKSASYTVCTHSISTSLIFASLLIALAFQKHLSHQ